MYDVFYALCGLQSYFWTDAQLYIWCVNSALCVTIPNALVEMSLM